MAHGKCQHYLTEVYFMPYVVVFCEYVPPRKCGLARLRKLAEAMTSLRLGPEPGGGYNKKDEPLEYDRRVRFEIKQEEGSF